MKCYINVINPNINPNRLLTLIVIIISGVLHHDPLNFVVNDVGS